MDFLSLNDGRKELYQWDSGRMATVAVECDIVHFSNLKYGESLAVEVKGGEVAVPNKLLLSGAPIYCWAFVKDKAGAYTRQEQTLDVIKRPKPSDYVYTETEVITIQKAVEDALQNAKESGEFKGETGATGVAGKDGANGKDGVDGKDGTSVTVSGVSESTEDGGNNVVTFSDGKTLTVKNGKTGKQGERGEQGIQGIKGNSGADGTIIWDTDTSLEGLAVYDDGSRYLDVKKITEIDGKVVKAGDYIFDTFGCYGKVRNTVGVPAEPVGVYLGNVYNLNGKDAVEVAQTTGQSTDKVMSQKAVTDELYEKAELTWEFGLINGSNGTEADNNTVCRAIGYFDARSIAYIITTTLKQVFAYDEDYMYLGTTSIPANTIWTNDDIFAFNSKTRYIRIRSNWGETPNTVEGTVSVLIDKRNKKACEQVDDLNETLSSYVYQEKEMPWEYGWFDGNTGALIQPEGLTYAVVGMEKILVADFKELTIDAGEIDDNGTVGSFYTKCFVFDRNGNLVGIKDFDSVGNATIKQDDIKALSSDAYYFKVLVTQNSATTISVAKVTERVHIICAFAENRLTSVENRLADIDKQDYWLKQRRRFSDKPIMVAYSHGANLGYVNTELAYVNAAIAGFEWLKADVQPTKDGKLIMCHDDGFTFNDDGYIATYNASNKTLIHEMTYAECMSKEYAVYYSISTGGATYRPKVCDLERFLIVCREFGTRPYIVIRKDYMNVVVPELLRLLEKYDFTENCIVNSFVLKSVQQVAEASNHRVMISTVTGYDKGIIPTKSDIDNILAASPNCTINFFANLSDGWDNETLMDAAQEVIDYAKSQGVVVGTSGVFNPHGVLKKGVGLCQCSCPCINTKATPIPLCIKLLNGEASAELWNGYGAKHTADVSIAGTKTIVVENIRIRNTSRDFADGVTPNLANIYPYTLTAVGDIVESVTLAYGGRIHINLTTPVAELDTSSAKRIFVKFVYGI